jgi:hypothetical protein
MGTAVEYPVRWTADIVVAVGMTEALAIAAPLVEAGGGVASIILVRVSWIVLGTSLFRQSRFSDMNFFAGMLECGIVSQSAGDGCATMDLVS